MEKTDVLILGGGLAGLSTAYHLNKLGKHSSLVVEKNDFVGGKAGTLSHEGFLFDHTGHLLHLHDSYGKKLILGLLRGNLAEHRRNSWIFSKGVFTRYPFQANTFGLPQSAVVDCLAGFLETVHRPKPLGPSPDFKTFCLRHFGEGITRHFMAPYNEKLWLRPLQELTTEWQGRFVPKPTVSEVVYGAFSDQRARVGYNASFRYPVKGGIQVLPDALAARLKPGQVRRQAQVLAVDLAEKTALVGGVGEIRYERLVNTLPLADFLDLALPLPAAVREARKKLRFNTVYNLNIGINRTNISDKHWIYFPEKKYPFYRAGFLTNFSKQLAPLGASSMYIEVARRPDDRVNLPALERSILDGLRSCGLLRASDKIVSKLWIPIRCGYVVYDFNRTPAVNTIFAHLAQRGVDSIGRYGGWKYSFMEETILDGKRCAERLA